MSKKLYSTPRWRRKMQRRSADEQARRNRRSRRSAPRTGFKRQKARRTLRAPVRFSLQHNPEEVVQFLNQIERNISDCQLTIDFEDVTEITPEAILAMTATIKKHKTRTVRGSFPKCPKAYEMLKESGFLDRVKHGLTINANSQGKFTECDGKTVDGVSASNLIQYGCEQFSGAPVDTQAAYCVILEAMQNTRDHAHVRPKGGLEPAETETWWAMVYSDVARNRICFALLDTGVGIFKSAKIKAWRKADRLLRKSADVSILDQMLQGNIESRTGLDYRGKGLPKMNQYSESGEIKNLLIVSNGVHGRIEAQQLKAMDCQFHGTLLYWEVER